MGVGRPRKSEIRQNMIEILYFIKKTYGYNLHKIYCEIFTPCTREVIYYHLRKGLANDEFKLEVKLEKGNYSWGSEVRKLIYSLGPEAHPVADKKVYDKLKYIGRLN